MINPPGSLKIRSGALRTLQRWDWERSGGEVELTGLIIFLSEPPAEELWLAVELFDHRHAPLAAAAVQLNSFQMEGWGVASIQASLATDAGSPYRLRVRYLEKNLPALTDRTLDAETQEIRPWNQKELRSSS